MTSFAGSVRGFCAALTAAAVLVGTPARAEEAPRVLALDEAVRTALERHPDLRRVRASTRAAEARVAQAFAPLLTQVSGNASYQVGTTNSARVTPSPLSGSAFAASEAFDFSLTANQLIYDGQTRGRYRTAQASADATRKNEDGTRLNLVLAVKNSYFQARAYKELVRVAHETLDNQERHLAQIQGFVEVGTRPRIDLVQARADRARAQLAVVNAENAYAVAKVQLVQAMGLETPATFEVGDETVPPLAEEEIGTAQLFAMALAGRPELKAQTAAVRVQELSVDTAERGYGPSVNFSSGVSESGPTLDSMRWNWNAQARLSWPIFQGGVTRGQVAEARANLDAAGAQEAALRQQILVDVEQARLGVRAAKEALVTADQLVESSRERMTLAEGRYQTGVGNIIELADAQLGLTQALAEKVQADYGLSTARAALLKALGKP